MILMRRTSLLVILLLSSALTAAQNTAVRVLEAGPVGPLGQLSEANEIRLVFSEPMVALGRVPSNPQIPWASITPRVPGQFRWSGTTILIFTPDSAAPLPYATTFVVNVDASATSASGRRLGTPYRFEFTTPTVELLSARWMRRTARFDSPVVLGLQFNQPVRPADVLAHLTVRHEPHEWIPPVFTERELARLTTGDPNGLAAFSAKVDATQRIAGSTAPVALRPATEWDRERFPPSDSLVMLETATVPLPEAWLALTLDAAMPSPAGRATRGESTTTTVELEAAFFADPMNCTEDCNPSAWNPVRL